jgi:uncharacterized protein (TIGR02266 family)
LFDPKFAGCATPLSWKVNVSRKKTILLVDDNRTFVLYLGILLKRMGFNVVSAENGAQALDLIKKVHPDLVLLDINMPALGDVETIEKIRSDMEICEVPVIMLTGEPDERKILECTVAGCNGFLPKPVPMDELHNYLQDFVYGSRGARRKHMRVQADLKVMVLKDGAARELRTDTLSEGGVYIKTESPYSVGSEVEVGLPVEGLNPLKLRGSVIYVRGRYDEKTTVPPGMAIEFKGVTDAECAVLGRLVSDQMAGDMAAGAAVIYMQKRNGTNA